jgi:hypothetical protein
LRCKRRLIKESGGVWSIVDYLIRLFKPQPVPEPNFLVNPVLLSNSDCRCHNRIIKWNL